MPIVILFTFNYFFIPRLLDKGQFTPYEVQCFELNELEAILNHSIYGCGTTTALQQMLLKKQY